TQPGAAYAVPESLYRSCHTLNGSMAMARVEIGLPLSEALNRLVSLAYNRPARLPPGTIATLRDTAARIEALLAYLGEPWRPIPQTADLEQRLRDHAAALDQPQEEPLERTGDVPADELAAGEDGVGQGESSIVVEELALPEVIELTGEISVADAADFAGAETASEALAGLHAESVDLDLTPTEETVSPPEPDFHLPAADREPDWLVGELDAGGSREPDLLLSLEDIGGDTSLPGGDLESAPVIGSDVGMTVEESAFDDSLSVHFEAEPDFIAEPASAGEEQTVFPDEFDVEEVIDADAADALPGTQEEPLARPLVAEPEVFATPQEAAAGARPDTTGVQRFPADERAEPAHSTLPFDPEIAAIFAEEAAELLEAADGAMAQLADGAPVEKPLADLQRYLHTLKGGARMSGLTVMGDFSHELETLLIRVSEGLTPRSPVVDELLQASLDQLHRLREGALSGEQQTLPAQLVARLRAVLHGEVAPKPGAAESQAIVPPPVATTEGEPESEPESEFVAEGDIELEVPAPSPQAIAADAADAAAEPEPLPIAPEPEMPLAEIALPAADRIAELARELERPAPPPAPAARQEATARAGLPERRESARVDSALLDHLLNNAGELSIFQSRLSQQVSLIQFNLEELGATVIRLREQLRKLEMETEAQIRFRHQEEPGARADFDPLELDRYSTIQQLSRSLAETTTDVNSLKDLLQNMARDAEALLVQQSRTATELQDGLMRTRMVPFQQHAPRLARLVRQTAMEVGKRAELHVQGGGELDRQVLERMLGPFEHMLRNAIVHGIETPAEREAAGKPATGSIFINLQRDGSEAVVELSDDGRGIDVAAVRRKAADLGFIEPGAVVNDEEAMQFILRPGFSTADRLTQAAGRGIGMDVVTSEVARLGGSLRISSVPGRGTTFTIRLPFTLAVTQALIVRVATEIYALPLPTVEGVIRISRGELMARLESPQPSIDYGGETYQFRHLGEYLGLGPSRIPEEQGRVSVILVRAGEYSAALITDEMQDSREVVVKPVGPQLATIRGLAGATILGDGRIAVILDMGILVRSARPTGGTRVPVAEPAPLGPLALVVDDSITMRRVTQRLLERNSFRVVTAKDGLEAISVLQDHRPDIILLDIEMPRMDGYEFAKHVRNNPDTADVPIVMITSRVSEKHKARAIEVGVNDYLGKPYQERGLLAAVRQQLKKT
ncbi:MAG: response regulator, partial [Gammaproteobacteria bacterium]|nr:response regulator [Gammaproteobacteria bacterium]